MRTKDETITILKLSDELMEIIIEQDQMTNGDFQGCLEAVIMKAVDYGKGIR